jgi:hypothetical protein
MNRITFNRPFYVPVARREFDTTVINIRDELGRLMPFEFGKSVATLHFRRRDSLLTSLARGSLTVARLVEIYSNIITSSRTEAQTLQYM